MAGSLDHLVIAARTLDEGAAYVRARLGVEMQPGGRHPTMGTHNRLLSLGAGVYLEVMAVDPEAAMPSRPRWMSLDHPATRALIEEGPALIVAVERTGDLEAEAARSAEPLEILSFARGPYRWRMALTRDGSLPGGGAGRIFIQWDSAHPAADFPDSGCRLLDAGAPGAGDARIATAAGEKRIPWRLPRNAE
jgi:hypothetical protein